MPHRTDAFWGELWSWKAGWHHSMISSYWYDASIWVCHIEWWLVCVNGSSERQYNRQNSPLTFHWVSHNDFTRVCSHIQLSQVFYDASYPGTGKALLSLSSVKKVHGRKKVWSVSQFILLGFRQTWPFIVLKFQEKIAPEDYWESSSIRQIKLVFPLEWRLWRKKVSGIKNKFSKLKADRTSRAMIWNFRLTFLNVWDYWNLGLSEEQCN